MACINLSCLELELKWNPSHFKARVDITGIASVLELLVCAADPQTTD